MWISNFIEWLGTLWGKVGIGLIAVALASANVFAQEPADPTQLGDIVFPIDLTSIATVVAAAGATMIGLWAVYKIGFKLVNKFIRRMGSTV